MYIRELENVIDKLDIIMNSYDIIRIVDPMKKLVINIKGNKAKYSDLHCFEIWGRNSECENCISMRAYVNKETYIKLEYLLNDIFMITAMPYELIDRTVVIEMIKKVTHTLSFRMEGQGGGPAQYYETVDNIYNIALKDSLTGIYNRRYINEKLPIDMMTAAISGHSIAIMMVDIDYFKDVNDTHGHLAGDCTLLNLANIIQTGLRRESDWVARYGGEEFLICMPGAGLQIANEMAETLRRKVQETTMDCSGAMINITVSVGVSAKMPDPNSSMDDFIKEADIKLYEAKRKGRNRVEA